MCHVEDDVIAGSCGVAMTTSYLQWKTKCLVPKANTAETSRVEPVPCSGNTAKYTYPTNAITQINTNDSGAPEGLRGPGHLPALPRRRDI